MVVVHARLASIVYMTIEGKKISDAYEWVLVGENRE